MSGAKIDQTLEPHLSHVINDRKPWPSDPASSLG
jgi:hypothetical protein